MAVHDLLRLLETIPDYRERVTHVEISEPVPAQYGEPDRPLTPAIGSFLQQHGIHLYSHQCEAINAARAGKNIIITTPTASGKSLTYNIPVFEILETDPDARALYLYPTKALSIAQTS